MTPYLSVVATARNDNHGGDLLPRMQLFINGLAAQCERHRLETELILVEWNPPADRPRLVDVLDWPDTQWCSMRIVEVPHELHATLEHSDRLPLFQMIAKNVGIRRARGEFVLATNVDILFPDELMAELARRDLQHDRFYRVDRHDVAIDPDPDLPIEETLRLCSENVVRICARTGSTDVSDGHFYRVFYLGPLPTRRLRYIRDATLRRLRDLATGRWWAVKGQWHFARIRLAWEAEAARVPLHTNASGDFTLLSRNGWDTTRAYPELETFSMHIDGLFLYQAHYSGLTGVDLPHPVFHIEHSHGFKPAPNDVKTLNTRLEEASIPQITSEQFLQWIIAMHRTQAPIRFNNDRWGFAERTLTETKPAPRRQEVPCVDGRFREHPGRGRPRVLEPPPLQHPPLAKPVGSREYFDEVEARKYFVEPHIPAVRRLRALARKVRVLEIGCGIGTDTINFARARRAASRSPSSRTSRSRSHDSAPGCSGSRTGSRSTTATRRS